MRSRPSLDTHKQLMMLKHGGEHPFVATQIDNDIEWRLTDSLYIEREFDHSLRGVCSLGDKRPPRHESENGVLEAVTVFLFSYGESPISTKGCEHDPRLTSRSA